MRRNGTVSSAGGLVPYGYLSGGYEDRGEFRAREHMAALLPFQAPRAEAVPR